MSTTEPLAERREVLRARMLVQRLLIARDLRQPTQRGTYPRSVTMRLLIQRPGLVVKLGAGIVALLRARSRRRSEPRSR